MRKLSAARGEKVLLAIVMNRFINGPRVLSDDDDNDKYDDDDSAGNGDADENACGGRANASPAEWKALLDVSALDASAQACALEALA